MLFGIYYNAAAVAAEEEEVEEEKCYCAVRVPLSCTRIVRVPEHFLCLLVRYAAYVHASARSP